MKASLGHLFLATIGFLAQAKPEGLRPLNIAVPANPQNATEKWLPKMAALIPSPKHFPVLKNDTKSEPELPATVRRSDEDPHITRGNTAKRGQFPWQVALLIDSAYFCGGSLISDEWVLTAAHCTSSFSTFAVMLGSSRVITPDSGALTILSRNSSAHPEWNSSYINNDIAVIKLPEPIDYTLYINPIRLPTRSQANIDFVGKMVQCSGWGKISDPSDEISSTLQYVHLLVITNRECEATFGELITDTKICVSTPDFKSPCNANPQHPLNRRLGDHQSRSGRFKEEKNYVPIVENQTTIRPLSAYNMAGADLRHVKPRDIVKPVYPKYTAQEWQEIYAAQKASPEYYPYFKKGTEPQPEFAGKVRVPLDERHHRITGGSTAARGQFPWQVALIVDNSWFCGGSLISSRWVLTAGHCAGSSYQVTLGGNRYDGSESGSQIVTSRTSTLHPQYNEDTINNDIAVVQLPSAIASTTYISPVRLRNIAGDLAGESVRVSGWGLTSDSSSSVSSTLNYVDLTVITNTVCANTYGNVITSTKICTSTPGGKSTCSGDSGGPLVIQESDGIYTEVGIVSFGAAAGCELGYPAAFTRVTSYLSWIESNTDIAIGR